MSLVKIVSSLTRRAPGLVDMFRRALPMSLKRSIGAALLPNEKGGTVVASDGRKFVMIPDRLFLQVVYDGVFEPSLTNFMTTIVQKGDVAVDVGSNFGWFATHLARHTDKVISFEPGGRIREIFKENIALNDMQNIDVRPLAIGSEPGSVTFVIEGDSERESALGYVVNPGDEVDENSSVQTETVPITTLDHELADFRDGISLMKVDCEGFEHEAFKGASLILGGEHPPVLITEANRETLQRSGSTREAMCDEISKYGYTLYGMHKDGSLYPDDQKAPALACIPDRGKYQSRVSVGKS